MAGGEQIDLWGRLGGGAPPAPTLAQIELSGYNSSLLLGKRFAMKKHIISIAGRPGSGKSTTAKLVAQKLGYAHFSTGDLMRSLGQQAGIDLLQTNFKAELDAKFDRLVDARLKEIELKEDRLVMDSRMGWHFVPSSYKVFLDLDLRVAAERIIAAMVERHEANETIPKDPEEYAEILKQRLGSEAKRYETKYGVNAFDHSNFDLVVDTAAHGIEDVVEMVVSGYEQWIKA